MVERFRREARAASRIGHPNIVDVTDSGTTSDGAFFFVMEYLDGIDVEQLIARDGALAIERALLIAAQVCRALGAAHEAGIIHRDLKPANVMLIRHRDEEDFVKVLDFGISKQSDIDGPKAVGLTRPDTAVGTPVYMAPEQVAGRPADERTDVYAVGELLFEMLTGKPPYSGPDVIAVFNSKALEDPVPVRTLRAELSLELEELVIRAVAREPVQRHKSMSELKDDILHCLTLLNQPPPGVPLRRRSSDQSQTERREIRRSKRLMWAIGAGLAAGLGTTAIVLFGNSGPANTPTARRRSRRRSRTSARMIGPHHSPARRPPRRRPARRASLLPRRGLARRRRPWTRRRPGPAPPRGPRPPDWPSLLRRRPSPRPAARPPERPTRRSRRRRRQRARARPR